MSYAEIEGRWYANLDGSDPSRVGPRAPYVQVNPSNGAWSIGVTVDSEGPALRLHRFPTLADAQRTALALAATSLDGEHSRNARLLLDELRLRD